MPEPFSRFLADTNRRFEENQRRFQEMWNKHLWDDDIVRSVLDNYVKYVTVS